MRTIVDIPEASLQQLAIICQKEDISRAEAVRRAVDEYVVTYQPSVEEKRAEDEKILRETSGAWKDDPFWKGKDSVEYIRALRAEWDRPWDPD